MRTVQTLKTIGLSLCLSLCSLSVSTSVAQGAWIELGTAGFPNATAGISSIPDDGSTLSSTINVTGFSGTLQGPFVLRVRLIGLQHEASGDLRIVINNITAGIAETVLNQFGYSTPGDAMVDFDTAQGGTSGFYQFFPGAPFDLWVDVPQLYPGNGDFDVIPSDFGFVPTGTNGAVQTWSGFVGLSPNGAWRIDLEDLTPLFTGSIQGWAIDMWVPDIPEPSTYAMMVGALGMLALARRRARS